MVSPHNSARLLLSLHPDRAVTFACMILISRLRQPILVPEPGQPSIDMFFGGLRIVVSRIELRPYRREASERLCGSAVEIRSIASKFDVAKRVHCEVTLRRLCPCRQEPFHSTREMTGKSCYNIMTTSSHCSTVIVYFLSKMKKGLEKNYRQLYKRRQISIQNKGVLTINLYDQGRGKHEVNEN